MAQIDLDSQLRSIAANVQRIRVRQKLTQAALAERADIDNTYLQRIERGSANISMGILVALANALDVPLSRLLRPAKPSAPKVGRPRRK